MQITPINLNCSFKSVRTNKERINQLRNEEAAIKWASEGCTGSLDPQKARELALRLELENLACQHEAMRWASEGCNSSLSPAEEKRLEALRMLTDGDNEVEDIAEFDEEPAVELNSSYERYNGVPASTFYRDWA